MKISKLLTEISIKGIIRIDAALEGDWSPTVKTIWSKENGFLGFAGVHRSHPRFKPSIELYFEGFWIGIHCYQRRENFYYFDEDRALRIIDYVSNEIGRQPPIQ